MKVKMYAIKDLKASCFNAPFTHSNTDIVKRMFAQSIMDGELQYFPEDYALFKLGEYNTEKGELIPQLPSQLLTGKSVIEEMRLRGFKVGDELDEEGYPLNGGARGQVDFVGDVEQPTPRLHGGE